MVRFLVCLLVILSCKGTLAQCPSLIPNGGFETYSALPNDDCGWSLATGWTNAATSSECNTNNGTPDYFHLQGSGPYAALPINYFSDILPFEGEAVMGLGGNVNLTPDAREYISIPLTSPLVVGNEYTFSFSMAIGTPQVGGIYTDGWGFLFSTGPVYQPTGTNDLINAPGYQELIPDVFTSETWQTFTFTFIADQAYDQFTFGNFLTDAQQTTSLYGVQDIISIAYVFVDDFVLEDNNQSDVSVDLGPDITLCSASITLDGADPNAIGYAWNTGQTSPTLVVNTPGLYILEVSGQCGVVTDSVLIEECPPLRVDLGADLLVCPNDPFSLNASVTGGIGPYSYSWNSGTLQTASNISLSTDADIAYIVEVTDANGTTDSDTILIATYPIPETVNLGQDTFICPGQLLTLDATVLDAVSYQWSNAFTTPDIDISVPGLYTVEVTFACSSDVDSILVTSGRIDVPEFVTDVIVCEVEDLPIGPIADSAQYYTWLDDESEEFPRLVNNAGLYRFDVTDDCGIRTFEVSVTEVNCDCSVFVPNSFTPNNDLLNDVFQPACECGFTRYDFKVYNRWGDLIFESNDSKEPWIGSTHEGPNYFAQDGIYHWVLNADSTSLTGELILHNLKGSILLMR
jgi:gliding motility-associated-like protein